MRILKRLLQEFGGLASRDIRYRDPSRDPGRGRESAVTPANRERQGPAPLTACRLAPYQQAHWPGPPMATRGTMVAVPTGSGPSGRTERRRSVPPGSGRRHLRAKQRVAGSDLRRGGRLVKDEERRWGSECP